jgi:hypothetical protein
VAKFEHASKKKNCVVARYYNPIVQHGVGVAVEDPEKDTSGRSWNTPDFFLVFIQSATTAPLRKISTTRLTLYP